MSFRQTHMSHMFSKGWLNLCSRTWVKIWCCQTFKINSVNIEKKTAHSLMNFFFKKTKFLRCLFQNAVFKIFSIFTGKHFCLESLFVKWILRNFEEHPSWRTSPVAAYVFNRNLGPLQTSLMELFAKIVNHRS